MLSFPGAHSTKGLLSLRSSDFHEPGYGILRATGMCVLRMCVYACVMCVCVRVCMCVSVCNVCVCVCVHLCIVQLALLF